MKFFLAAACMLIGISAAAQTNEVAATCGQIVTITATPDPGYEFLEWQDGNTDNPRTITITSELDVLDYSATFVAANRAVLATVNDASMGSVSGAGTYGVGEQVVLTATPTDGCYEFVRWSDGITTAVRTITVSSDAAANSYEAVFQEKEFRVRVSAGRHGSVTISK